MLTSTAVEYYVCVLIIRFEMSHTLIHKRGFRSVFVELCRTKILGLYRSAMKAYVGIGGLNVRSSLLCMSFYLLSHFSILMSVEMTGCECVIIGQLIFMRLTATSRARSLPLDEAFTLKISIERYHP